MRRLSLILTMMLAVVAANVASAQYRVGPMVGMTMSTLKYKQNLIDISSNVGVSGGVATELMFPGIGFGVDAGLFYQQRGATLNLGEKPVWAVDGYGRERSVLHYLEIPMHLRFKWTRMNGVEDYVAPLVYVGPSFGIMLGHNSVRALQYSGGDVGFTVGLGAEVMRNWQILCGYTWAVTYAEKTRVLDDFSGQNRCLNLRAIYLF